MARDKGKPRWMTAAQIGHLLALDNERDDEFGSAKELKRETRKAMTANGHTLGHFKFKGSRRWDARCIECHGSVHIDVSDDPSRRGGLRLHIMGNAKGASVTKCCPCPGNTSSWG